MNTYPKSPTQCPYRQEDVTGPKWAGSVNQRKGPTGLDMAPKVWGTIPDTRNSLDPLGLITAWQP